MGVVLLQWIGWVYVAGRYPERAIGPWLVGFGVRYRGRSCKTSFMSSQPAARLLKTFVLFVHISCRNGQRTLRAQAPRRCCADTDTSRKSGHRVT
ncbi:uncharacterized protein B0H64DRAFT_246972 [Chaetomium fimeti]|uniref:Secreted protein n=1 Tax=Chaetomium fimeti TaxID=1854472 RepID=A0AAE0LNB8_9PEZI|nr:hypothetical protein B0H64DRAFT_246972 [Chaetomium fimeti]